MAFSTGPGAGQVCPIKKYLITEICKVAYIEILITAFRHFMHSGLICLFEKKRNTANVKN